MSRNSFHIPHQDIPVGPHFIIALLPYLACTFTVNCYISQQMHNNPQKECLRQCVHGDQKVYVHLIITVQS
jgi:hypothetical protein